MMFIIANKDPHMAVKYLIANTDKRFYFKQLIELGQLICSAGISSQYEKSTDLPQGRKIQNWIKKYPWWTFNYYRDLLYYCRHSFRSIEALQRAVGIHKDLLHYINNKRLLEPETAIFRYISSYKSVYPTNSELPIDVACEEYTKYIEKYKFKKETV